MTERGDSYKLWVEGMHGEVDPEEHKAERYARHLKLKEVEEQ